MTDPLSNASLAWYAMIPSNIQSAPLRPRNALFPKHTQPDQNHVIAHITSYHTCLYGSADLNDPTHNHAHRLRAHLRCSDATHPPPAQYIQSQDWS